MILACWMTKNPLKEAEIVLLLGYANVHSSTIGEKSVKDKLDHVCLDNQSHYSLDVTEFLSGWYERQILLVDTIKMNEKYHQLNPTGRKKKKNVSVNSKNRSIQNEYLILNVLKII